MQLLKGKRTVACSRTRSGLGRVLTIRCTASSSPTFSRRDALLAGANELQISNHTIGLNVSDRVRVKLQVLLLSSLP